MSSISPNASVSRETTDHFPPIGSTVHIRTMGARKRGIPHTIESYFRSPSDGVWVYKAVDFAGWSHIDTVSSLFG